MYVPVCDFGCYGHRLQRPKSQTGTQIVYEIQTVFSALLPQDQDNVSGTRTSSYFIICICVAFVGWLILFVLSFTYYSDLILQS